MSQRETRDKKAGNRSFRFFSSRSMSKFLSLELLFLTLVVTHGAFALLVH